MSAPRWDDGKALAIKDDTGEVIQVWSDYKVRDGDVMVDAEPPMQTDEAGRGVLDAADLPGPVADGFTEGDLPVSLDRVGPPDSVETPGIGPEGRGAGGGA